MTEVSGAVRKMRVSLNDPVSYTFIAGDQEVSVNDWLGRKVSINSTGLINCVHCDRVTKKSFNPVSYTHLTLPTNREV